MKFQLSLTRHISFFSSHSYAPLLFGLCQFRQLRMDKDLDLQFQFEHQPALASPGLMLYLRVSSQKPVLFYKLAQSALAGDTEGPFRSPSAV